MPIKKVVGSAPGDCESTEVLHGLVEKIAQQEELSGEGLVEQNDIRISPKVAL